MNQLYINGQFVESASSNTLDVRNPVTEQVITTITLGTPEDVDTAVAYAEAAQAKWAKVNAVKRAKIVQQLAVQLEQHKQELARIYVEEQGKPLSAAIGEIDKSIAYITYMTSLALQNNGEVLQSEVSDELVILTKKPVGVTAGIIPWNAPIFVLMRKLIPALVTGCAIVIKPSEETPLGALKIAEYLNHTDIPKGLVHIIPGTGADVGDALSRHPKIALVSITGSTGAGKAVMKSASTNVKKVNLELGGKRMDSVGYFYEPTILTNVAKDATVMQEEIFGPVLPIAVYTDFDEVLREANDSELGLSSYIFTENLKEAMQASEQLLFGEVYVNCEAEEAITGYHAGWRQSGLGGADGTRGFDEYLNTTVTYIRYE